ncbi:MAG: UDP-N-acetylglucosamine 1-carboxyvinyltransferase [Rickettsiales bacterium]|nr:UDP-N-acetylglucosamine 1-carboxyvinyltransferase [Rickettsiales bacterium]
MDKIEVEGINSLKGNIQISGSKNSSLPILASTLLIDEGIVISNIPNLSDVVFMTKILKSLGSKVNFENSICKIKSNQPINLKISYELVRKMRASFLILGPLLTKYGYAEVSLPGGCAIGTRPVDFHISALEKMGAEFVVEDGYIKGNVKGRLKGCEITLKKISVGATENIIMAATLAEGETIIKNAACEPEISDLSNFLISAGAEIKGHGTSIIKIKGKKKLRGCEFSVMPDRIEAGTFALCVMGCSGNLILENVNDLIGNHLKKILNPLNVLSICKKDNGNKLEIKKTKKFLKNVIFSTKEFPGFPTDLQAQLIASLTKSQGKSVIKENIFENRFMHVSELRRMGANLKQNGSKIIINGVKEIYGAEVMATDLRASSSLIIAGLMASGKTIVNRVYHLDRGYENLEEKLRNCGVKIRRFSE